MIGLVNLLALWTFVSASATAAAHFEPPVLVGSSRQSGGAAVNASCGGGRWWFPAGGYAIDNETLATTVSLQADGDACPPTGQPREVVAVSRDAGRSWHTAWFVDAHLKRWNGLSPGPSFCGAGGSAVPGGGRLCPAGHTPPTLSPDGTGVLQLPATLWQVRDGQLTHRKQSKLISFRCPAGERTLPGGWGPGPVQPPGSAAAFRVATCNATQVVMRSIDGGWTWESSLPGPTPSLPGPTSSAPASTRVATRSRSVWSTARHCSSSTA